MSSNFDRDSAVTALCDGRYSADISDRWNIQEVPNGGYLMAVAARALRERLPHPDPFTITGHFFNPIAPGPVEIGTEILKSGKTLSYAEARVLQTGAERLRITAAYGDLGARRGFDHGAEGPPSLPAIEDCLPAKIPLRFFESVDVAFTPDTAGWLRGENSEECVLSGWARFADGREPDVLSLILFADGFPPPIFRKTGPVAWVPTVELTVQVRARPCPGPLRCRFRTRFVTGGFAEEDGEIWDAEGHLVALSRQLETIRLPSDRR